MMEKDSVFSQPTSFKLTGFDLKALFVNPTY